MQKKRRFPNIRNLFLSLGALILMAAVLIMFTGRVSDSVQRETERIAHDAIMRGLISCYAAEGSYPHSLTHLEERYGVVIDTQKYIVDYVVLGTNVLPEVTITQRKQEK